VGPAGALEGPAGDIYEGAYCVYMLCLMNEGRTSASCIMMQKLYICEARKFVIYVSFRVVLGGFGFLLRVPEFNEFNYLCS